MIAGMGVLAPRFTDRYLERSMFDSQMYEQPADGADSLYEPAFPEGRERGRYPGRVIMSSLYTSARLHRARTAMVMLGVGLGVAAGISYLRREEG